MNILKNIQMINKKLLIKIKICNLTNYIQTITLWTIIAHILMNKKS